MCVIDNEGLSVDAPEFDLARTWYRWPMTARQQRVYAEGYGIHDHSARFETHFLHWALMAVLDSAAYRIRAHPASARVPLDRLAALRETSIVFATLISIFVLKERVTAARGAGIAVIALGAALLLMLN